MQTTVAPVDRVAMIDKHKLLHAALEHGLDATISDARDTTMNLDVL